MRVKLGRALVDRLPATRAAWEAGDLGFSHAWEIVRAAKDIDDPDHVAVLDRIFADATPALSPADLKNLADRILAQETPDQTAKKNAGLRGQQQLSLSQTMNRMWDLHGRFEPEAGTLIKNVLDAFTPTPDPSRGPRRPGRCDERAAAAGAGAAGNLPASPTARRRLQ